MKKIISALILTIAFGTVTYAAGLTFAGSKLSFTSGSTLNLNSTVGTIQGFATHPPTTNQATIDAYYDKLLATGATWQRVDGSLNWYSIQSTSSVSYVWGSADLLIDRAIAKGIETVYLINHSPSWAAYAGCVLSNCPPANSTVIATFCTQIATRYLGKIHYYEFWNEQNLTSFSWLPDPIGEYVTDLNACYDAIKAVDPTATIISGGLSPAATSAGTSYSPIDWLTAVYAHSPAPKFDILGIHPYTYPTDPECPLSRCSWNNLLQSLGAIRTLMIANGDTSKKMWATEVGAPTCGLGTPHDMNQNSFTYGTDYMKLEAQAQIAQKYVKTVQANPVIERVFWYTLVDTNSADNSDPENCFGLYYSTGGFKPLFWIIKNT